MSKRDLLKENYQELDENFSKADLYNTIYSRLSFLWKGLALKTGVVINLPKDLIGEDMTPAWRLYSFEIEYCQPEDFGIKFRRFNDDDKTPYPEYWIMHNVGTMDYNRISCFHSISVVCDIFMRMIFDDIHLAYGLVPDEESE